MLRVLVTIVVFASVLFAETDRARGDTFTVRSAGDTHDLVPGDGVCGDPALPDSVRCTFRAAVEEANALPDPDTILFAPDLAPISLSLGPVTITRNRTIIDGALSNPILDGLADPFYTSLLVLSSDSNEVRGLTIRRARFHGLAVFGSNNCVGDSTGHSPTLFLSNGIDRMTSGAIYLGGTRATRNLIVGCLFGYNGRGELLPNQSGIVVDSAASMNTIGGSTPAGRNYLCGSRGYGVVLRDRSSRNLVHNCFIGLDASGLIGYGNGAGGVLLDAGATLNRIGGVGASDRNFISWNTGPGITVGGSETVLNSIAGNYVGLDYSGSIGISNGIGVLVFDAASNNTIGGLADTDRNFIAGNSGDGIRITGKGTIENRILGNFIGTDTSGYSDIGNGWDSGHGIFIADGAGHTTIGGGLEGAANVISGNPHAGICLSGSSHNTVLGNLIGVSVGSISSTPNGTGILIEKGSTDNTIGGATSGEGNTISGNRAELFPNGAGVAILDVGTDFNRVIGNMIGTDQTGTRPLRNGSCGVVIGNGAGHNFIGGPNPGERNVISGNGAGSISIGLGSGVHLFGEGTEYNQVCGNYIGVSTNGSTQILNFGNGVGLYNGAAHNMIGGLTASEGNVIARNPLHGIFEDGPRTVSNSLLNNLIFDNDSLGIAIRVPEPSIPHPPTLSNVMVALAEGAQGPPHGRIQVYKAAADPSGHGEGRVIIGEGFADSSGYFSVAIDSVLPGETVTAIATDTNGSSSEFALNRLVDGPTSSTDHQSQLPKEFSLDQNFPNPFNPSTEIRFSIPRAEHVVLNVINLQGEEVIPLVDCSAAAGRYVVTWDGRNRIGGRVASGIYFYRLVAADFTATKKMILLK